VAGRDKLSPVCWEIFLEEEAAVQVYLSKLRAGNFAYSRDAFAGHSHCNTGVVLGGVFGGDFDAGAERPAVAKAVELHLSDGVVHAASASPCHGQRQ